jgi:CDGSH-type Zn-finger protein
MPRLVRFDATGPLRVDPQEKPIFICQCGLSQNMPYCDGGHKATKEEPADKLCVYDAARRQIIDHQPLD